MSTIAVIGGTGYAGRHIVAEAAGRGHTVLSVSRKVAGDRVAGVTYVEGTLLDVPSLLTELQGVDAVVIARDGVSGKQLVGYVATTEPLRGDALKAALAETLPALAHTAPPRWTDGATSGARAALKAGFAAPDQWGPHQVFATLRRVMPPETVITADSGAHRILVSQMWDCPSPRGMLQSSGLCTMACAVPLAAGAKLGRPSVPVLAFVGDAGLEMGAGELASLSAHGLPILICVLVDDSLSLIEMKQRATQRPNLGVDFGGPGRATDFAALARAFGGHGVAVSDPASLASEAEAAMARATFTLIAASLPRRAYDGAF